MFEKGTLMGRDYPGALVAPEQPGEDDPILAAAQRSQRPQVMQIVDLENGREEIWHQHPEGYITIELL